MFATRSVIVLMAIAFTALTTSSSSTSPTITADPPTTANASTNSSFSTETSPSSLQTSASPASLNSPTSASPTTSINTSIYTTTDTTLTFPDNDTDNVTSSEMTSVSSNASKITQTPTNQHSADVTPTSSEKNTTPVTSSSTPMSTKPHSTVLPAGSTLTTQRIFVTTRTGSTTSQEQTSESQVTLPPNNKTTTTTKYATYYPVNGFCPRGYVIRKKLCVYLCEDKVCENGGVCAVVSDNAGSDPVALCRCKTDTDKEYSGENCETSKISHIKERKITLGVLIPVVCILLSALMCTCLKLKRHGNSAQAMRDKYDINSGAL